MREFVCMCVCVCLCAPTIERIEHHIHLHNDMQVYVRIEEMVEKLTEVNLKPERKAEQMTSTSGEVLYFIR